jgi:CheY-like chemotaxis protein
MTRARSTVRAGLALVVSSPRAAYSAARKRALVVDRDAGTAQALSACLLPELEVHVATDALAAEGLLERLPQVDLAFIELALPDARAEHLLQALGRWPDAIRILLAPGGFSHAEALRTGPQRIEPLRTGPPRIEPLRTGPPRIELPRNRHLAHLVLAKPASASIVRALKRATLGLLND